MTEGEDWGGGRWSAKVIKEKKKTQLSEQEEEEEGGGGLEEDRISFFLLGTTHTQMKDGEGEGGGGGELHWDEVHSARVSNKLNNARLFSFCLRAFSTKKRKKKRKMEII